MIRKRGLGRKNPALLSALLGILLVFSLLAAGCDGSKSISVGPVTGNGGAYPLDIMDDTGTTVTIKAVPQRIVSLSPGNTEILFALNLGDRVVGVTEWCTYPEEAQTKTIVGKLDANLEPIVALQPDLVVASATLNKITIDGLRNLGIPVVALEPKDLEGVYKAILTIAEATGQTGEGARVVGEMKAHLERILEKTATLGEDNRMKVFIEVSPDLFTAGQGTFLAHLVELAGGVNIAADVEGWKKYSPETVVQKNPDVIIATEGYYVTDLREQIRKRPGWDGIAAVQQDRLVTDLDTDLLNHPGPRTVQAVEVIAKALYPELFR